jgi:hypothetical protein
MMLIVEYFACSATACFSSCNSLLTKHTSLKIVSSHSSSLANATAHCFCAKAQKVCAESWITITVLHHVDPCTMVMD